MRIAVNTRLLLLGKLDGIGWFTYETLKRITTQHGEHEFLFLFDRPFSQEFIFSKNITPLIVSPPARHPVLWYTWFEFSIPRILEKYKADIFFSPDGYLSLRSRIPSLAVIHDINFHHRPEDLPPASRIYYRSFFPRFANRADRIVTVSNYSKSDICESYNIPEEKVQVVYNGANPSYSPLSDEETLEARQKFTDGIPYFVFVGTLHPRKNIPRLLKAFDKFRDEHSSPFNMVIVGEKMFMTREIEQTIYRMTNKNDVVFTGRLSPEDLRCVLGAATALTFVPLFEGFGIPAVEAMYCDTPILASNVTSLPEVAGDAALFVDPYNIPAIKEGMLELANNADTRNQLRIKGREQRRKFSWDKTAEKLWENIEELIRM